MNEISLKLTELEIFALIEIESRINEIKYPPLMYKQNYISLCRRLMEQINEMVTDERTI